MKVKEVMSVNPRACTLTNNLAEAASVMWEHDCGVIPVVADGGRVVGLVTDRDICMAAALRGRQLANIAVEDTISGEVFSCAANDDVRVALKTMQRNKVRRLPVLAADGTLEGILSMNDIVIKAKENRDKASHLSYTDVVNTYKAICQHRIPEQRAKAAGAS
jgi:CBS domain-containing protein